MSGLDFARRLSSTGVASAAESVRSSIVELREEDTESTAVCENCGHEDLEGSMVFRDVVSDTREFEVTDPVTLCDGCEGASSSGRSLETCRRNRFRVDRERVLSRAGGRCRACGISQHRLHLDGQRLELHPIVPVDGGGYHHEFNVVPLCPYCHRIGHGE